MFRRNKQPNWRSHGSILGLLAVVISIAIAGFLFINRQFVADQVMAWQYEPSSEIAAIAERSDMSDEGIFYFYVSHPSIDEAKEFNQNCGNREENTAILGCYNGQYIYIYNVTDERLDGIKEVTAAHEMLHVVYDRLGESEKNRINTLLDVEAKKLESNEEFSDRMAFYARTEPGERYNELHSIVATEVSDISSELEDYYKTYFNDRGKVLKLHDNYASVFRDLQESSERLTKEINDLANEIETQTQAYNVAVSALNEDVESFNRRANDGSFSSDAAFNSERGQLLARAEQLEGQRQNINANVTQYETLREQLSDIAVQSEALNRSIDSTLEPAPSL